MMNRETEQQVTGTTMSAFRSGDTLRLHRVARGWPNSDGWRRKDSGSGAGRPPSCRPPAGEGAKGERAGDGRDDDGTEAPRAMAAAFRCGMTLHLPRPSVPWLAAVRRPTAAIPDAAGDPVPFVIAEPENAEARSDTSRPASTAFVIAEPEHAEERSDTSQPASAAFVIAEPENAEERSDTSQPASAAFVIAEPQQVEERGDAGELPGAALTGAGQTARCGDDEASPQVDRTAVPLAVAALAAAALSLLVHLLA